jgi:LPS-assembly protein
MLIAQTEPPSQPEETNSAPAWEPPESMDASPEPAPPEADASLPPVEPDLVQPDLPYQWRLCPPLPARDFYEPRGGDREAAQSLLTSDYAVRARDGIFELEGRAVAQRGDQRIAADRLIYDANLDTVDALGTVRYDEPDLTVQASEAHFDLATDTGNAQDVDFLIYSSHARGRSSTAFIDGPGLRRFEEATYSTCAYGSNAWRLRAATVRINSEEGWGRAKHARLEIKHVPVAYTPHISFPIDDRRKTGFLVPSWGTSDTGGFEFQAPFYWNIAPNRDATLIPRYLNKRGYMLGSEFRYLNRKNSGRFYGEYLPSDDELDGETRHFVSIRHDGRLGERWRTTLDVKDVSDDFYLDDLGDSLSASSTPTLERRGTLDYNGGWWQLRTEAQNFETLDGRPERRRPYERLPAVDLLADPDWSPLGLRPSLFSEAVRFQHPADNERDTGTRLYLAPRLALPIRRTAFNVTPALTLTHAQYDLDRVEDPGLNDQPSRTLPVFSLDSTVFFERDMKLFDAPYLQTLEPRLFYLYVPEVNQEDIPLFDTGRRTLAYRQLFAENRFNGIDRIGDANQIALAVTTRFLDPDTGDERFRASVGELFYLEDREVTLQEDTDDKLTDSRSDIAAELHVELFPRWTVVADGIWDPLDGQAQESNFALHYRAGRRQLANLSYRFRRNEIQQIDASLLWPLGRSWHVLGRWNYDFQTKELLEGLAGIEYDTCCWAFRFVARSYFSVDEDANALDNASYLFQLELKGFTSVGDKIESVLQDGILGYVQ